VATALELDRLYGANFNLWRLLASTGSIEGKCQKRRFFTAHPDRLELISRFEKASPPRAKPRHTFKAARLY